MDVRRFAKKSPLSPPKGTRADSLRRVLPLGLVFALAMAGCLSPSTPSTLSPLNGTESLIEESPLDVALDAQNGTASLRGIVVNEQQAPLPDVHVALWGTDHWTTTGRLGGFAFDGIPPGNHTLRADAADYRSLQVPIGVAADKIHNVKMILAPASHEKTNLEHVHDFWQQETVKTLFADYIQFNPGLSHNGKPYACLETGSYPDQCWTHPIRFEPGTLVWPGTAALEIRVTWPENEYVKRTGFVYKAANQDDQFQQVDIESGEWSIIPLGFDMADGGHERFTAWDFQLRVEPQLLEKVRVSQAEFNEQFVGPFRVEILAIKGLVIPSAPPHPQYWASGNVLPLLEAQAHWTTATQDLDPTLENCKGSYQLPCFRIPHGTTVPPGTTRIELTLTYWSAKDYPSALLLKRGIWYRTAAVDADFATASDLKWAPLVESENLERGFSLHFSLPVEPEETDVIYQQKSHWMFFVAYEKEKQQGLSKVLNECRRRRWGTR